MDRVVLYSCDYLMARSQHYHCLSDNQIIGTLFFVLVRLRISSPQKNTYPENLHFISRIS
jgi:hypothetical protein